MKARYRYRRHPIQGGEDVKTDWLSKALEPGAIPEAIATAEGVVVPAWALQRLLEELGIKAKGKALGALYAGVGAVSKTKRVGGNPTRVVVLPAVTDSGADASESAEEEVQPVTPEPVTPEPVTPEPVTGEPVTPEPVTPEPEPVTPTHDRTMDAITRALTTGGVGDFGGEAALCLLPVEVLSALPPEVELEGDLPLKVAGDIEDRVWLARASFQTEVDLAAGRPAWVFLASPDGELAAVTNRDERLRFEPVPEGHGSFEARTVEQDRLAKGLDQREPAERLARDLDQRELAELLAASMGMEVSELFRRLSIEPTGGEVSSAALEPVVDGLDGDAELERTLALMKAQRDADNERVANGSTPAFVSREDANVEVASSSMEKASTKALQVVPELDEAQLVPVPDAAVLKPEMVVSHFRHGPCRVLAIRDEGCIELERLKDGWPTTAGVGELDWVPPADGVGQTPGGGNAGTADSKSPSADAGNTSGGASPDAVVPEGSTPPHQELKLLKAESILSNLPSDAKPAGDRRCKLRADRLDREWLHHCSRPHPSGRGLKVLLLSPDRVHAVAADAGELQYLEPKAAAKSKVKKNPLPKDPMDRAAEVLARKFKGDVLAEVGPAEALS